jgi:uncharacterized protein
MSFSLSAAALPAFLQTLKAMDGFLGKAAAHAEARKIAPEVFLTARLAPDMFALTRQVQIACDFAKNTIARLGDVEIPKFADTETSFAELAQRIASTAAFVNTASKDRIDASVDRDITFPVGGHPMTLKGGTYLMNFALPNFYFHSTAAYSILRHNGVELGKRDFMGV